MIAASRLLLAGAAGAATLPRLASAEHEAALDAEFLEYLSTFEGDQENWTWFADGPNDEELADDESANEDTEQ